MIAAVCTYCSRPKSKDAGYVPALRRYLSDRITALATQAESENRLFLILSGRYGLITGDTPLPDYDHLLMPSETAQCARTLHKQMTALNISAVDYHTADPERYPEVRPYLNALAEAAGDAGVTVKVIILPGNPV